MWFFNIAGDLEWSDNESLSCLHVYGFVSILNLIIVYKLNIHSYASDIRVKVDVGEVLNNLEVGRLTNDDSIQNKQNSIMK